MPPLAASSPAVSLRAPRVVGPAAGASVPPKSPASPAQGGTPISLVGLFGSVVGFLVGSLLRIRRAHVVSCMQRAGIADAPRAASAMYRSLFTSAVELLVAGLAPRSALHADVAASHTGNWDVAACAIARELPLLVVTKRLKISWIDAFWQKTRARRGVRLTEARGALALAKTQLAAGGAVAMMIDQVPLTRAHGVVAEFLGAAAFVDKAAATLAARMRAPLVVSAAHRLADGSQELLVLDVLVPPTRAGAAWIEAATKRATLALEAFVRQHPSEWLWMHRRWKTPTR